MKDDFYYLWTTGRGLYVLLSLLLMGIFVSPLLIESGIMSDIFIEGIFALILIIGVFTTPCSTALKAGMLLLAVSSVVLRALDRFNPSNFIIVNLDNIFAAITLVAFSILITQHFIISKCTLRHRITASVAVYLIFGVLWARLYEIVHLLNPAAFSLNENLNPFSLLYFSFVTLLTIGYGDIVPVSTTARSLAILEGVVGQLYLIILISSLVSEFSAQALKSSIEN